MQRIIFNLSVYILAFFCSLQWMTAQPRVVGIGDSTMYQYDEQKYSCRNEMRGWVQMLPVFLKQGVEVTNAALAGRSSKSFYSERWEKVRDSLQPGDYLFIQFGHNDEKNEGLDFEEGRKDERGTAAWGQYQDYLTRYIEESRAKGVIPILFTPVVRGGMAEDGKLLPESLHNLSHICGNDSIMNYPLAMRKLAEEKNVPLIDMTLLTQQLIEEYGYDKAKNFVYCEKDDTHLRATGGLLFAKLAMKEMLRQNILTEAFLSVD